MLGQIFLAFLQELCGFFQLVPLAVQRAQADVLIGRFLQNQLALLRRNLQ